MPPPHHHPTQSAARVNAKYKNCKVVECMSEKRTLTSFKSIRNCLDLFSCSCSCSGLQLPLVSPAKTADSFFPAKYVCRFSNFHYRSTLRLQIHKVGLFLTQGWINLKEPAATSSSESTHPADKDDVEIPYESCTCNIQKLFKEVISRWA